MSQPTLIFINGTAPKSKPDYAALWKKAFCTALLAGDETKTIVSGVKYINASCDRSGHMERKEVEERACFIDCIMLMMAWQTPRRLMQFFPPSKTLRRGAVRLQGLFHHHGVHAHAGRRQALSGTAQRRRGRAPLGP